jgi:hypothetical protein
MSQKINEISQKATNLAKFHRIIIDVFNFFFLGLAIAKVKK